MSVSKGLAGHRLTAERDSDPADVLAEDLSRPLVQLPRQEPPMTFQECHLGPTLRQGAAVSRPSNPPPIQTQRAPAVARLQEIIGVLHRSQAGKPLAIRSGDGRDKRDGAGRQPLVHGDWLIVEVGSSRGTVIALDKRTGREVWASPQRTRRGTPAAPCRSPWKAFPRGRVRPEAPAGRPSGPGPRRRDAGRIPVGDGIRSEHRHPRGLAESRADHIWLQPPVAVPVGDHAARGARFGNNPPTRKSAAP